MTFAVAYGLTSLIAIASLAAILWAGNSEQAIYTSSSS